MSPGGRETLSQILKEEQHPVWGFPCGSVVKNLFAIQEPQETRVGTLGWEDPLEKGMATHSSILAWNIPWTEEPGRGQSPWGRKESDTLKQSGTHS